MDVNGLDVLIVGAGPAGLTLAHLLHREGVAVRIVDRDAGPTAGTRAPVLWRRTQEVLAAAGLREAFLEESQPLVEEGLHSYDRASARPSMTNSVSLYGPALLRTQAHTEQTLVDCLARAGCLVEYGSEVIHYAEVDGGGEVAVRVGGRVELIRAKWVVAAERSENLIRSSVGLDFEWEKCSGFPIHVADLDASWTYSTPRVSLLLCAEEHIRARSDRAGRPE